jgi:hypothetical protein
VVVVKITTDKGANFKGTFDSMETARNWYENHHIKRSGQEHNVQYIEEHLDDREAKFEALRDKRRHILDCTDWLFVSDFRVDTKFRKIYMEYRQYLRDLPKIIGKEGVINLEEFDHYLRRRYPEEFMDGGNSDIILKHFYSKIKGK